MKFQLICAVVALSPWIRLSAAAPEPGGPTQLVITYRCPATHRPTFRGALENAVEQFDKWKSDGVLEGYRILFNWYNDADTWDAMAILSFHKFDDVARWKEIERSSPGGLSAEALKWGAPVNTYAADLLFHETAPGARNGGKSVFFVVPYSVSSMDEYKPYAGAYVIPQTKGWIREGILSSYSLYINRYYTGRPWDALLVLEYKDLESFGRRESVIAKVRAALAADPAWKAVSDNKRKVRTEKETVLADELGRR